MRSSPSGGVPFLALDLRAGFSTRGCDTFVQATAAATAPFPEPRGADAPPPHPCEIDPLRCVETDDDAYSTQCNDACWRVLFRNEPRGDAKQRARISAKRKFSLLGLAGHAERSSAWTHILGSVMFLVWAIVRPFTPLDSTSTAGVLSTVTSYVVACTFAVSTAFHTLGTVRTLAPLMRLFDHGAIDVTLAVACTTDTAVATGGFADAPWETIADPLGVAVVILAFFLYRRTVLKPEDTEIAWGDCALGLFRVQHADFEFSALRSASYVVLSFGFLMLIPSAWRTLSVDASAVLIACNAVALLMLIIGMLLDNVFLWPDVAVEEAFKRNKQRPVCLCHSERHGCIMTSHALWHVFSLLSVLVQTFGREYAISDMSAA